MGLNELSLLALVIVLLVVWLKWPKKANPKPARSSSRRDRSSAPQTRQMVDSTLSEETPSSRLFQNSQHAESIEFNVVRDLSLGHKNGGNPVAEAVTLMKYGRTKQAIEILQIAFRTDPPPLEVGLKLAEILLSANDLKGFQKIEARFLKTTGKEGPFWEALKILKADYMGGDEYAGASLYKDFGSTEISNHGLPLTGFSKSKINPPSRL